MLQHITLYFLPSENQSKGFLVQLEGLAKTVDKGHDFFVALHTVL